VIKGCGMLAIESMSSTNPAWEDLQEVQKAADRAATLTSHLLAFTRQQPIHAKTVKVNEAIVGVSKMLGRVLGEDVHLEMELNTQAECVRIDRG
jgi:C4-dicarboxylate-specific signal transduction histidine kinase